MTNTRSPIWEASPAEPDDLNSSANLTTSLVPVTFRAAVCGLLALTASLVSAGEEESRDELSTQLASVPGVWEPSDQPPASRDLFAWYRCYVKVPNRWTDQEARPLWRDSVQLRIAHLADACEIYVNGRKIGAAGEMPPDFASADDEVNHFKIPAGLLRKGAWNVIAIRVYHPEGAGGFKGRAPVLTGYYLECELRGKWEFTLGDSTDWALPAQTEKPPHAAFDEFTEATSPLARPKEFAPGRRLSPEDSRQTMRVADDLVLEPILTEPIVAQPLHLSWDERGRLWVVQYRQYPYPAGLQMVSRDKYYRAVYDQVPQPPPHHVPGADRITIHEDTNDDGTLDHHTVFLEGLNIATSVAQGRGGVWVLNPPYLLFVPDEDRNDVPDDDPVVHLEGFGLEDTHAVANNLCWGPDGWLYGAQGSEVSSRIKVRGSKAAPVYCQGPAIWRYHPETRRYEIFAEGGGNAFGIEIDAHGRTYSGHNGSNTRGFYYVPGGYYDKGNEQKYGKVSNLYAFGLLPSMAADSKIPRFSHDLVKYEGTTLPERYAGRFLSIDPLHHHLVLAAVETHGSSFQTHDLEIVWESEDVAVRPVAVEVGPDGAVYVADFYEEFIAHGQHFQGQIDPGSGRIYRLRSRSTQPTDPVDFSRKSSRELLDLLHHPSKWHRRTALRLIAERQETALVPELKRQLASEDGQAALEALWALNLLDAFDENLARQALDHANPHVRRWVVRLLGDVGRVSPDLAQRLAELAAREPDAEVRNQLACTARRLSAEPGLAIVRQLMQRDEDANDPHIPLLLWWALESWADSDRQAVLALFDDPQLWQEPLVTGTIVTRIMRRYATAGSRQDLLSCARLFQLAPDEESRERLMAGFEQSFQGRALAALPVELAEQLAQAGGGSLSLRVRLGNTEAVGEALDVLRSGEADREEQIALVHTLGEVRQPRAIPVLLDRLASVRNPQLQTAILTSLQNYEDEQIAKQVIDLYGDWPQDVQQVAQTLLTSRKLWARKFLDLVDQQRIEREMVSLENVHRMMIHRDDGIAARVRKHWPSLESSTTAQMQEEIARLTKVLAAGSGDPYRGKELYAQSCAKCHRLFGEGGRIGPELTHYARDDSSRMLLHIVNPSAEIREGFESHLVVTSDGRAVSGFLFDQDSRIIVLRGADGQNVTVPRDNIEEMIRQKRSLMPENLLKDLTDEQIRDLFAYLRSGHPVTR